MNRKQRRAIWGGVTLIVLMGLFPPWSEVFRAGVKRSVGYALIFNPPDGGMIATIDVPRLLVQWFLVVVVVGAYVVTMRERGAGTMTESPPVSCPGGWHGKRVGGNRWSDPIRDDQQWFRCDQCGRKWYRNQVGSMVEVGHHPVRNVLGVVLFLGTLAGVLGTLWAAERYGYTGLWLLVILPLALFCALVPLVVGIWLGETANDLGRPRGFRAWFHWPR